MAHYLFVGDASDVLGVWEVEDAVAATKLSLKLALMYPGCTTFSNEAESFERFKESFSGYDFEGLEPDQADAFAGW